MHPLKSQQAVRCAIQHCSVSLLVPVVRGGSGPALTVDDYTAGAIYHARWLSSCSQIRRAVAFAVHSWRRLPSLPEPRAHQSKCTASARGAAVLNNTGIESALEAGGVHRAAEQARRPPPPFTTSTPQQEASAKLGLSHQRATGALHLSGG